MRRRAGLEHLHERQLPGKVDGALARRQREVALAGLHARPRPPHLHPHAPERAVERGELRVVGDLVVAGGVGHGAVETGAHVVAVGDQPAARALRERAEHALGVHRDRVLGHLAREHVLAGDGAAAARLDLPAHVLARLREVGPRAVEVGGGAQPPRVDGVDAEVRAVGLADHRAVQRLQLVGDLQALGEVDDRLAPGEPLLLPRQREQAEQRAVAALAALDVLGHVDGPLLDVGEAGVDRRLPGGGAGRGAPARERGVPGRLRLVVGPARGVGRLLHGGRSRHEAPRVEHAAGALDGGGHRGAVRGELLEQLKPVADHEHREHEVRPVLGLEQLECGPAGEQASLGVERVEQQGDERRVADRLGRGSARGRAGGRRTLGRGRGCGRRTGTTGWPSAGPPRAPRPRRGGGPSRCDPSCRARSRRARRPGCRSRRPAPPPPPAAFEEAP